MREVTDAGLEFIIRWEGERLTAYRDTGGIWTIGVGHTTAGGPPTVYKGMVITKDQSREILRSDLQKVYKAIAKLVKVPLTDNQYDVLCSFTFNLGEGNLSKSTLLKKLNNGDYKAVPAELMRWVNDDGKKVQGLINRRESEAEVWQTSQSQSHPSEVQPDDAEATSKSSPADRKSRTLFDVLVQFLRLFFGRLS